MSAALLLWADDATSFNRSVPAESFGTNIGRSRFLGNEETSMKYPRILIAIFALLLSLSTLTSAQDPGWPRQIAKPGGILIVHQPQVDEWKEFKNLTWRQAFEMTPTRGKPVIGPATLTA